VRGAIFEWPFERNRRSLRVSVQGQVIVNSPDLATRAAVDGLGIAYTIERLAELFLRSGQLVRVLEDWSPSVEGLFLYYHRQRQVAAALRAFIDMIRTVRPSEVAREPLHGDVSASRPNAQRMMALGHIEKTEHTLRTAALPSTADERARDRHCR
jgi:hypothetical protein